MTVFPRQDANILEGDALLGKGVPMQLSTELDVLGKRWRSVRNPCSALI